MISKVVLKRLYVKERKSMQEIAHAMKCSLHRVQYWMDKHGIKRRSISEAVYQRHNPDGDPFHFLPPRTKEDHHLFGLGIGLYWGEGTKANKHAVRLGNSDPLLLHMFLKFLVRFFDIKKDDVRCGIQIFSDSPPQEALRFWSKSLGISPKQFYKITVTPSRGDGTYRRKQRYGVLTLYYNNKKMRDTLVALLPVRQD